MATEAFITEARRGDAPLIALVKVYLTDPTTKTLFLASNFIELPDFSEWEGVVSDFDPIRAPGSLLGTGPDLVTAGFSLATRSALGFQPEAENLSDLFQQFRWLGAKVEIFLWSQRLTSISDLAQVFSGIVQSYNVGSSKIDVKLIQRRDWNRIVSVQNVTRDLFPRAPERSVGLPIPIVYGAIKPFPLRAPWPNPFGSDQNGMDKAHGGQLGVPAIMVDTGRGGNDQKMEFRVASHAIKSHGTVADSTSYFIKAMGDRLGVITPTELFSSASGSGFRLGDDFGSAIMPIRLVEQAAYSTDPATNPNYAIDIFDESSFSFFKSHSTVPISQGRKFRGESVSAEGQLVEAFLLVAQKFPIVGAGNFKISTSKNGAAAAAPLAGLISLSPEVRTASLGVAWGGGRMPDSPWNFSEIEVTIEWTSSPLSAEEFYLYFAGIFVVYKPKAKIYRERQFSRPRLRKPESGKGFVEFVGPQEIVPPDTEIESDFFATVEGHADDGSGTFTGTAGALIERPCDVAQHLLRNVAAQSGLIEIGTGVFGSFVDARSSLKTWRGGDWKVAFAIAEASDVETHLSRIAAAGLAWVYIDPETDRWVWVPWLIGSGSDYGRQVWRDDIVSFEIDSIPSGRVPSGIRIPYAWDFSANQYRGSVNVSPNSSRSGHSYFDVRDQYLSVVAGINDKIDVDVASTNYTYTIPPGDYTDETLIPALQAINGTVSPMSVAFGFRIVAGENDRLDFKDGSAKNVFLAAGLYTGETLAAEVASKMNSVSSNWSCSYSRTTNKFTISRSSGSAQINPDGGQAAVTACNAAIGFDHDVKSGGSSYTSDFSVEEDRIAFAASFAFSLELATGTNGTQAAAPKTAADFLGFDGRFDTPVAKWARAHSPKGIRERQLRDAGGVYGQTREVVVEGRALYDTDTARELRNRLVDWMVVPRIVVRFSTFKMPDVRRGELVRFDDLDNFGIKFPRPGSNGLWAGRKFRVLQTQKRLGPKFDQEIECIENGVLTPTVPVDAEMLELDGAVIPVE